MNKVFTDSGGCQISDSGGCQISDSVTRTDGQAEVIVDAVDGRTDCCRSRTLVLKGPMSLGGCQVLESEARTDSGECNEGG